MIAIFHSRTILSLDLSWWRDNNNIILSVRNTRVLVDTVIVLVDSSLVSALLQKAYSGLLL